MGILTRFRSKLQSFTKLTKLESRGHDEKAAQTVCLLSVVLLLPYFARAHASLLVGGMGIFAYSCLVLPMVISANYKFPLGGVGLEQLAEKCKFVTVPVLSVLKQLYAPIERTERYVLKLNFASMANQVVFFMLCDRVLIPGQKATCLYTLMFYNVLAYCISYVKELIEKEDWSPYVHITDNSNVKHLAMSATKFVLEWTKAITFTITIIFILLICSLGSGLENYQPSSFYTLITWFYYMITEKVFADFFPFLLSYLQLDALESLESLWGPVILRATTIIISALFTVPLLVWGQYRVALFAVYHNVYLRGKEMTMHSLKELNKERAVLEQFRYATEKELDDFDDVCAVCLCPMRLARITPCHHMFHADCLRQCLKTSDRCPVCKRDLKFD